MQCPLLFGYKWWCFGLKSRLSLYMKPKQTHCICLWLTWWNGGIYNLDCQHYWKWNWAEDYNLIIPVTHILIRLLKVEISTLNVGSTSLWWSKGKATKKRCFRFHHLQLSSSSLLLLPLFADIRINILGIKYIAKVTPQEFLRFSGPNPYYWDIQSYGLRNCRTLPVQCETDIVGLPYCII